MTQRYWFRNPAEELREVLVDIGRSHVSSEFVEALIGEAEGEDDKRERDDTLDEEAA